MQFKLSRRRLDHDHHGHATDRDKSRPHDHVHGRLITITCMITSSIQSRQSADSRSQRWRSGTAARRRPAHRWPASTGRDARPAQTAPRSSGTAANQSTLTGDVEIGCAVRYSRWPKQSQNGVRSEKKRIFITNSNVSYLGRHIS